MINGRWTEILACKFGALFQNIPEYYEWSSSLKINRQSI
jgi:hypothetical protein